MKVWLDDIRHPCVSRLVLHEEDVDDWLLPDVVWVKSEQECIRLLETGEVTRISLDFDLGYEDGSGGAVADWIEQAAAEGRIPRLRWSVHSANPVGAKRMRVALHNADRFWECAQ